VHGAAVGVDAGARQRRRVGVGSRGREPRRSASRDARGSGGGSACTEVVDVGAAVGVHEPRGRAAAAAGRRACEPRGRWSRPVDAQMPHLAAPRGPPRCRAAWPSSALSAGRRVVGVAVERAVGGGVGSSAWPSSALSAGASGRRRGRRARCRRGASGRRRGRRARCRRGRRVVGVAVERAVGGGVGSSAWPSSALSAGSSGRRRGRRARCCRAAPCRAATVPLPCRAAAEPLPCHAVPCRAAAVPRRCRAAPRAVPPRPRRVAVERAVGGVVGSSAWPSSALSAGSSVVGVAVERAVGGVVGSSAWPSSAVSSGSSVVDVAVERAVGGVVGSSVWPSSALSSGSPGRRRGRRARCRRGRRRCRRGRRARCRRAAPCLPLPCRPAGCAAAVPPRGPCRRAGARAAGGSGDGHGAAGRRRCRRGRRARCRRGRPVVGGTVERAVGVAVKRVVVGVVGAVGGAVGSLAGPSRYRRGRRRCRWRRSSA
jgi:hypothetical protein